MPQRHEYTVIPAPARGEKARGARTGIERFSVALSMEINRMAEDGWEYIRAEVLPCEERAGLTGRQTVYHNVLVFRRSLEPVARVEEARTTAAPHVTPAAGHGGAVPIIPVAAHAPLTATRAAARSEPAAASSGPTPAPQPVARMEPPLSAAGHAEPPADWPDGQAPLRGDDPDLADERDTGTLAAESAAAPPRKGIFSSIMPGTDTAPRGPRLGPAER